MSLKHVMALLLAIAVGAPSSTAAARNHGKVRHRAAQREHRHRHVAERRTHHRAHRRASTHAAPNDAQPATVVAVRSAGPPPPTGSAAPAPAPPEPLPIAATATHRQRLLVIDRRMRDLEGAVAQAQARMDALKSRVLGARPPPPLAAGGGATIPSI
jgi:hypothetical protein